MICYLDLHHILNTQYLSYAYTFHDYYVLLTSRYPLPPKRRPILEGKVYINGISEHAP